MSILYFIVYLVLGFVVAESAMNVRVKTPLRETSNDKWLYLIWILLGPVMLCFILPILVVRGFIRYYSK